MRRARGRREPLIEILDARPGNFLFDEASGGPQTESEGNPLDQLPKESNVSHRHLVLMFIERNELRLWKLVQGGLTRIRQRCAPLGPRFDAFLAAAVVWAGDAVSARREEIRFLKRRARLEELRELVAAGRPQPSEPRAPAPAAP